MISRRPALAVLLVLVCLAPLVPAAPPPAHAGMGPALATKPDAPTCTIPVTVLLVDSPSSGQYHLDYSAKTPDSCPGTVQVGVLATGTPMTGFTWSLGCETGSLGPLGSATPFEVEDACSGLLVQGTLDFALVGPVDIPEEIPTHPAYLGQGEGDFGEAPFACLDRDVVATATWDPRGFWYFIVGMVQDERVLSEPLTGPGSCWFPSGGGFPAYGSPETGFVWQTDCATYTVGPLGPQTPITLRSTCDAAPWSVLVDFAPVA